MDEKFQLLFLNLPKRFTAFLPDLFAGIVVMGIGWLFGWLVKRLVIQLSVVLNLERHLTKYPWGRAFTKADVRYGLYRFLGNIFFFIIFLIFLDIALIIWDLKFLSNLLREAILVLPRVAAAVVIFSAGWLIALWAARALQRMLFHERVPGAMMIVHFARGTLLVFFFAAAFYELNLAREIVIIGFTSIIVTLGAIATVLAVQGGKEWVGAIRTSPEKKSEGAVGDSGES